MAHYDCSDCGESGGIAYGYCDNCTPKEVLRLKELLQQEKKDAAKIFDQQHMKAKNDFIEEYVSQLQSAYNKAYQEGMRNLRTKKPS